MQAAKALTIMRFSAGSSELTLLDNAIGPNISGYNSSSKKLYDHKGHTTCIYGITVKSDSINMMLKTENDVKIPWGMKLKIPHLF